MVKTTSAYVRTNRIGVRAWLDGEGDLDELTTVIDNILKMTGDGEAVTIILKIMPGEDIEEE